MVVFVLSRPSPGSFQSLTSPYRALTSLVGLELEKSVVLLFGQPHDSDDLSSKS